MILLSRRSLLAIVAVVDVAAHGAEGPVAAKLIAARHHLKPRHLETMLQALVHADILKGLRGPRGGYMLARGASSITAADVVAAAMEATGEDAMPPVPESRLVDAVVGPRVKAAGSAFLDALSRITVEDLRLAALETEPPATAA